MAKVSFRYDRLWKQKVLAGISDGLEEIGDASVISAKASVPVRSGRLRDSIRYRVRNGKTPAVLIGAGVEYAMAVHENPHSNGYKFLERNIDSQGVIDIITKQMRLAMKRIRI